MRTIIDATVLNRSLPTNPKPDQVASFAYILTDGKAWPDAHIPRTERPVRFMYLTAGRNAYTYRGAARPMVPGGRALIGYRA